MQTTTITIKGTHCRACKILIEDVCKDIPGISSSTVNFETGMAEIVHDDQINFEQVKKEIEALGEYQVILTDVK